MVKVAVAASRRRQITEECIAERSTMEGVNE